MIQSQKDRSVYIRNHLSHNIDVNYSRVRNRQPPSAHYFDEKSTQDILVSDLSFINFELVEMRHHVLIALDIFVKPVNRPYLGAEQGL